MRVASCTDGHEVQHCFPDNMVDRKLDVKQSLSTFQQVICLIKSNVTFPS